MPEILSVAEINDRFDGEWILLADPDTSETLEVRGGTLLFHSKDRDEVYRRARELKPRHSAILFTGRLPRDAVVILIAR